MKDQRGFTLVELMVGLAIVLLIVAMATAAYLKLLLSYKTHGSVSESYMSNLTGLELLRYDIEMAGFGLPVTLPGGLNYLEAAAGNYGGDTDLPDPQSLNDATTGAPHAFVMVKSANANNSAVLAIKSTLANISATSKKWSTISEEPSYQQGTANIPKVKLWGVTALDPVMDFTSVPHADNFIMLNNQGQLQTTGGTCAGGESWCYSFVGSAPDTGYYHSASAIASSCTDTSVYYIYGLDNSTSGAHRMPFNRVDYYLAPTTNQSCADYPNAFALYRGVVKQADGTLSPAVLIDCVHDFQVAFGIDPSGNGTQNIAWQADLNRAGTPMTASQIQQYLREVRVYTIYQEGTGKISHSPQLKFSGSFSLGSDIGLALSSWTPSGQDIYYHWKVAEIDVKPVNLLNLPSTAIR